MTDNNQSELIAAAIESYVQNVNIKHSHLPNELMYGYCSNGQYQMQQIDIYELSEFIYSKINHNE